MSDQVVSADKLQKLLQSDQEEERLAALKLVDRKNLEPYKLQIFFASG